MKKIILGLGAALVLCSCDTTVGTKVTPDQAQQFVAGRSTISDVKAKLGQPTNDVVNSDGTETLKYAYSNTHRGADSFIPFANMNAEVDQTSSTTSFIFSRAGILKSSTTDTGNTRFQ